MSWTANDIERLKNKGLVVGEVKPRPVMSSDPKQLREMKQILKFMQIDFVTEYKFLEDRKFRFDIAFVDKKIGVEYEGLFSKKSRHTTVTGYSGDCEKYNLAVLNGWRVLRYTQMTYQKFIGDINRILDSTH